MHRLVVVLSLFFTLTLGACTNSDETGSKVLTATETPQEQERGNTRPKTAEKLNLNTATKEEFMTVPDVGERMAYEFDEHRPYMSIVQFRREMGKYVDEEQVSSYEDYVYVPIDMNESDAETVAQILGLDFEGAQQLVGTRPFESKEAFIAAVLEVAGGISSQFAHLYMAE